MNWYDRLLRREAKDAIPNPRDNKRKQQTLQSAQEGILRTTQFFVFALALLLLAMVS